MLNIYASVYRTVCLRTGYEDSKTILRKESSLMFRESPFFVRHASAYGGRSSTYVYLTLK